MRRFCAREKATRVPERAAICDRALFFGKGAWECVQLSQKCAGAVAVEATDCPSIGDAPTTIGGYRLVLSGL
jgi:hypothetical protein